MESSSKRVQEALLAYLEYGEMGGPEPDTSHLSAPEQDEYKRLIEGLQLIEGVPFGVGRGKHEEGWSSASAPSRVMRIRQGGATAQSELVVSQLHEALPFDARIDPDPLNATANVGEFEILESWVVGTFGGRIRVWLLDVDTVEQLEEDTAILGELSGVFRGIPDTAAIALVGSDLSCLLIEPQDCAVQIQVPDGSLVGRRYRRPLQPLTEGLRAFMHELVPYWDPVPQFRQGAGLISDGLRGSDEFVRTAIHDQVAIGQRARKGNLKKDVLIALGDREIAGLTKIAEQLLQRDIEPDDVEARLERLAKRP